jgi:hypothetical protein
MRSVLRVLRGTRIIYRESTWRGLTDRQLWVSEGAFHDIVLH